VLRTLGKETEKVGGAATSECGERTIAIIAASAGRNRWWREIISVFLRSRRKIRSNGQAQRREEGYCVLFKTFRKIAPRYALDG